MGAGEKGGVDQTVNNGKQPSSRWTFHEMFLLRHDKNVNYLFIIGDQSLQGMLRLHRVLN